MREFSKIKNESLTGEVPLFFIERNREEVKKKSTEEEMKRVRKMMVISKIL